MIVCNGACAASLAGNNPFQFTVRVAFEGTVISRVVINRLISSFQGLVNGRVEVACVQSIMGLSIFCSDDYAEKTYPSPAVHQSSSRPYLRRPRLSPRSWKWPGPRGQGFWCWSLWLLYWICDCFARENAVLELMRLDWARRTSPLYALFPMDRQLRREYVWLCIGMHPGSSRPFSYSILPQPWEFTTKVNISIGFLQGCYSGLGHGTAQST